MKIQVSNTSIRNVSSALESLPKELLRSSENAVLRAGAKPIEKAAKSKAPVRDGTLKKSIGTNVKKVNGITSARVGPRKGFKGKSLGFRRNKKGVKTERFADPNKYSHLVEFGTSHSAARPFIRPAIDSASSETADAMAAGLDKHLTRTVARLRRKAGMPT